MARQETERYQTFDHTADLGMLVFGCTVEELFANAGWALFDLLAGTEEIREETSLPIRIEAADREDLFVRWLGELLFLGEGEGILLRRFSFSRLEATALEAVAWGEKFDPSRHAWKREIKAVTYHRAEVREKGGRWEGRVILDL